VNEGEDEGISYYRWTGTKLELLRFVRSEKMSCARGKSGEDSWALKPN
jgi:hypothetical protein